VTSRRRVGPVVAQRRRLRAGRLGEDLAAGFLARRGVRILARNVRTGRGEIDIHGAVAGRSVAFEVKTIVAATPEDDAVYRLGREKAATIRKYARALQPPAYRIDLVAVTLRPSGPELRWVPYAD
jgi:putative endonuclease